MKRKATPYGYYENSRQFGEEFANFDMSIVYQEIRQRPEDMRPIDTTDQEASRG